LRRTSAASRTTTNRALAAKIESAATVIAIVSLARADRRHAHLAAHFDRDPWLLNTPAGTVDLRTGALRPHQRADGFTKVTAVAQKAGTPTRWLECLERRGGPRRILGALTEPLVSAALTRPGSPRFPSARHLLAGGSGTPCADPGHRAGPTGDALSCSRTD
jgi:putative DNA primase/helicase